ncbi:MAG TPA: hypothetical protein VM940_08960 [Chthoniobacterales bacterium]|nr:hypothetical protein [Chthoniobacterales bacterium]
MKRIFPSYSAAIAVGALGVPLLIYGSKIIAHTSASQLLLPLWAIVAFLVPVFLATYDRAEAARWRRGGFFGSFIPPASGEAFHRLYIPAWKRMAVWFVSAAVSGILLKLAGVDL